MYRICVFNRGNVCVKTVETNNLEKDLKLVSDYIQNDTQYNLKDDFTLEVKRFRHLEKL